MSDTRDSVTITFTIEQYHLLLWVTGAGYRRLQEAGQANLDLEQLDRLRAHILTADLFDSHDLDRILKESRRTP